MQNREWNENETRSRHHHMVAICPYSVLSAL